MGRPSLRELFVLLVTAVLGWHLIAVTAAAVPPNRYSDAVRPMTGYLAPYFTQNWRLFAPNPVAQDRKVLIQGAYRDEAGAVKQTEWVDWTAVELDLVHHRIIGNRGGYVTNKLIESLSRVQGALTTEQRNVLLDGSDAEPPSWSSLAERLDDGPGRSALRYERATARLATDVLASRFPDLDLIAVRYSVQVTPVVSYPRRNDPDAEAARTTAERLSGWRVPEPGNSAELDTIAEFDERHR